MSLKYTLQTKASQCPNLARYSKEIKVQLVSSLIYQYHVSVFCLPSFFLPSTTFTVTPRRREFVSQGIITDHQYSHKESFFSKVLYYIHKIIMWILKIKCMYQYALTFKAHCTLHIWVVLSKNLNPHFLFLICSLGYINKGISSKTCFLNIEKILEEIV